MKKVFVVIAVLALTATGFTSCKKCTDCKVASGTFNYDPGEYCGTPAQVKTYEDSFRESYGLLGTVTCE